MIAGGGRELPNPTARCSGMDRATFSRSPEEYNCVLLREKDTQVPPAARVSLSFQKEHKWAQHGCKDGCFSVHRGRWPVIRLFTVESACSHQSCSPARQLLWLSLAQCKMNKGKWKLIRGKERRTTILYFTLFSPCMAISPSSPLSSIFTVYCKVWKGPGMSIFRI